MLNSSVERAAALRAHLLKNQYRQGGDPKRILLPSVSTESSIKQEDEDEQAIELQPSTQPITQGQLINEVKGIYAGLVMVEKKCVEIDTQQAVSTNKLTDDQWQALIALHRTLLHEHHDFFLASQHPAASAALKKLANKYAMPARMWRHGIHSFLELLRHRLPDSLEHMLSFVYLAYSMMALLMESVPSFKETWIECLGDLARYRMAIEEIDMRDREVWAGVARMWYDKAADRSPNVGRIQHHLAVLARPNIVKQLFFYSKALTTVQPFPNARDSIMLLFNPFLVKDETASQRYPPVESTFVKAMATHFTGGTTVKYAPLADQYVSALNGHIGRTTTRFKMQGPEMASAIVASLFNFGHTSVLGSLQEVHEANMQIEIGKIALETGKTAATPEQVANLRNEKRRHYAMTLRDLPDASSGSHRGSSGPPYDVPMTLEPTTKDVFFPDAPGKVSPAFRLFYLTCEVVFQRIGDKNCLPFCHVVLAFLYTLALIPDALPYVEGYIPWESIITFLNTVGRSGVDEIRIADPGFPQPLTGSGRQLPEDFLMRGLAWARQYFPDDFFQGQVVDEDERTLERPSHVAPRTERCLWIAMQLESVGRWFKLNQQTKQFSLTDLALRLEENRAYAFDSRSPTMSIEREDTSMTGVKP